MKSFINPLNLVKTAVCIALGISLQIADNLLLPPINIPGGKLGLANIVNVYSLAQFAVSTTFLIAVARAILGGLLFGGTMTMMYSLAGAILSTLVMVLIWRLRPVFSAVGACIVGAAAHNIGQVCLAAAILNSGAVFAFLPSLLIISAFSGAFIGYMG
ncbi:MAG: Gx transporter family protein, partial [Clostridiales bacterium]|nr:Gx transporter family protein [Clostridiales bacterium]